MMTLVRTHSIPVALTATLLAACSAGEITDGEDKDVDPAFLPVLSCPADTVRASTVGALFLRSGAGTGFAKVLPDALPYGQTVCIVPAAGGALEVTGGSYSTDQGSRNQWYQVRINELRGYVAAYWVDTTSPSSPSGWTLQDSGSLTRGQEWRRDTGSLGAGTYIFDMTGTGDADLYVRKGSAPTLTQYDCRPYKGSANESCTVELAAPGTIHLMVRGYSASSTFELAGRQRGAGGEKVLYIQVLEDTGLAGLMAAHPNTSVVITPNARAALGSSADPDETFYQLISEKVTAIEAQDPSEVTLVISGHSIGTVFFGDINGQYLHLYPSPEHAWSGGSATLERLASEHPVFARAVRHIYLLGCNTAWPANASAWRAPFPGTISVSGYAGSAPGNAPAYRYFTDSHAIANPLGACVADPASVAARMASTAAASVQNYAHTVVSRCDGNTTLSYKARMEVDLYHARQDFEYTRPYYQRYLAATEAGYLEPPSNSQSYEIDGHPTPRYHYVALWSYVSAIETTPGAWEADQLPALRAELMQSIRLTLFQTVKRNWLDDTRVLAGLSASNNETILAWLGDAAKRTAIASAYRDATGQSTSAVTVDQIKTLSRAQTIRFVSSLESRLPGDAVVGRLRAAFIELDPVEVPEEYI